MDPSINSPAVNAMLADWDLVDALLGGTPAMRAAGEELRIRTMRVLRIAFLGLFADAPTQQDMATALEWLAWAYEANKPQ